METNDRSPTRVEIVIDTDRTNPDLLFNWVATRAETLVHELEARGIGAQVVSVEIDGVRRYCW